MKNFLQKKKQQNSNNQKPPQNRNQPTTKPTKPIKGNISLYHTIGLLKEIKVFLSLRGDYIWQLMPSTSLPLSTCCTDDQQTLMNFTVGTNEAFGLSAFVTFVRIFLLVLCWLTLKLSMKIKACNIFQNPSATSLCPTGGISLLAICLRILFMSRRCSWWQDIHHPGR